MPDERSCKDLTAAAAEELHGGCGFAALIGFDVSLGYSPSPLSTNKRYDQLNLCIDRITINVGTVLK